MKYKVEWTEAYETEVEAEAGLSEDEIYDKVDFEHKNCFYTGLDDLKVEALEDEDEEDDN